MGRKQGEAAWPTIVGVDVADGWETTAEGTVQDGVLTIHSITSRYHGEAVDGKARPSKVKLPSPQQQEMK